jgi:hypothetical protein
VVDESMTELKGASCDEGVVETLSAVLEEATGCAGCADVVDVVDIVDTLMTELK